MENYEMRENHRALLVRSRLYLLHNIHPTEEFWGLLISKGTVSMDMMDEIRSVPTTSEKISRLLDMLPTRGPSAFDAFCNTLLESDHAHVAEYLKTHEATDQFRSEMKPHCADFSDHTLDRFVNIFRKSTPSMQRFAERKFEILLQEQEEDLTNKDAEIKELESKNMYLQLQVTQLRNFLNTCRDTTENLVTEINRSAISPSFLQDEKKHLQNLRQTLEGISEFQSVREFYGNMHTILTFLETFSEPPDPGKAEGQMSGVSDDPMMTNTSLVEKIQHIITGVNQLVNSLKPQLPCMTLKTPLEKVLKHLHEIFTDVTRVKDTFKVTLKQKHKLEGESIMLLHSIREIRRLEREVKEKRLHITELSKHGQLIRRKTKNPRRELEQIQFSIQQKRDQLDEVQRMLERKLGSADLRIHSLLNLIPDLHDDNGLNDSEQNYSTFPSEKSTPLSSRSPTMINVDPSSISRQTAELPLQLNITKINLKNSDLTAKSRKPINNSVNDSNNLPLTGRTDLCDARMIREKREEPNDSIKIRTLQTSTPVATDMPRYLNDANISYPFRNEVPQDDDATEDIRNDLSKRRDNQDRGFEKFNGPKPSTTSESTLLAEGEKTSNKSPAVTQHKHGVSPYSKVPYHLDARDDTKQGRPSNKTSYSAHNMKPTTRHSSSRSPHYQHLTQSQPAGHGGAGGHMYQTGNSCGYKPLTPHGGHYYTTESEGTNITRRNARQLLSAKKIELRLANKR